MRTVLVMLYCDSLVASHIIDHGKRWLSSVRDALLTASFFDVIDDDEFVLLYDAYSSKLIFPYWKFPRLSVDEWGDVEYKTELRYAKKHLPELCEYLGIPEKNYLRAKNSMWWDGGPVHFVKGVGIPL